MDPERVAPLPQFETSPIHSLDKNTSGTIQPDPFNPSYSYVPRTTARINTSNFSPYASNALTESPNPEKLESIQSPLPVRLPESKRDTMAQIHSGIDWIVPSTGEKKEVGRRTVGDRLKPTLEIAIIEKDKYAAKAKWTGFMLNAAIGMQVLLGSLTTGLSALAVSGGKSTAAATTALGALATLVASYLARARGSNEPELSITRTKDLEQFIRECRSFQMDYGHLSGHEFDPELIRLRRRFEELLGNANGERKLSPPA